MQRKLSIVIFFYRCLEQRSSHGMSRRMQAFYNIKAAVIGAEIK
jgi:hypothetical protein